MKTEPQSHSINISYIKDVEGTRDVKQNDGTILILLTERGQEIN
jgi:hypothetical protein